jgi:hypothetical protein
MVCFSKNRLTRSLHGKRLALGTLNELLADLLEGSDLARAEGDTDLVHLLQRVLAFVLIRLKIVTVDSIFKIQCAIELLANNV